MSTELTPEELLALADDNYVGWEEDAREALRDAAVNARIQRERAAADPPRVEDMAPWTTFTAEGEGVPGTVHRFMVTGERNRHGVPVLSCSTHGTGALANYVDRSTIRDVTPPKEA